MATGTRSGGADGAQGWVDAVGRYAGRLRSAIKALKYDGVEHHAAWLGQSVFAHLDRTRDPDSVDLVVVNPTHRSRAVRHTELLLRASVAADARRRWPFDDASDATVVKANETPTRGYDGDEATRWRAAAELRAALRVRRPDRIAGRRVLVLDDVVTTGAQLAVVRDVLLEAGAAQVDGLAVAWSSLGGRTPSCPAASSLATLDRADRPLADRAPTAARSADRLEGRTLGW